MTTAALYNPPISISTAPCIDSSAAAFFQSFYSVNDSQKSRTGLQVSVCLCPSGSSLLVSGSLSLRLPLQSSSTPSCEYSRPFFTDSHLPERFQEAASPREAWDFGDLVTGELRSNWDVLGQLSSARLLGALYSEPQSRPAVLPR